MNICIKAEVMSMGVFENDFASFKSKNDVLTLMLHLGYLAYDEEDGTGRIPNEEIKKEFSRLLENAQYTKLADLVKMSEKKIILKY